MRPALGYLLVIQARIDGICEAWRNSIAWMVVPFDAMADGYHFEVEQLGSLEVPS